MRPVEFGIPIPGKRKGIAGDLRRLDTPGASMFFEFHETAAPDRFQNNLIRLGRDVFGPGCITTRQVVENGVGGIRIWRLK